MYLGAIRFYFDIRNNQIYNSMEKMKNPFRLLLEESEGAFERCYL